MKARLRKEAKKSRKRMEIINEMATIRGIVIPVDWDEEGEALSAAISSPDEQEYLIEQDARGKELLGLMRQEIEAHGAVRKGTKGRKIIKVKSYGLWRGGSQE
jgi:hypothetical protein